MADAYKSFVLDMDNKYAPHLSLINKDKDNEVRIASGPKSFISIKDNGITLAGGSPGGVKIQGLSQSLKYSGLMIDLPFPLSIMPTTPVSPMPKQVIVPPFAAVLKMIKEMSALANAMVSF